MHKPIIIAGIGTDVGKTVVSAIVMQVLEADYWKPISCGEKSDTEEIQNLVSNKSLVCHPEAYHFQAPLSPHQAADLEEKSVDLNQIHIPQTDRLLVIESVGGVMVPFTQHELSLDLFVKWDCSWIIVSSLYLGSINHTLLTIEALQRKGVSILGLVFNGEGNSYSEDFIRRYTRISEIGRIDLEPEINSSVIRRYAEQWKQQPFWNRIRSASGTPIHNLS